MQDDTEANMPHINKTALLSVQFTTGLSCSKLEEGTLPTDSIVSKHTHSYDTRHRSINKIL